MYHNEPPNRSISALYNQYRDRLLNSMIGLTRNREIAEDITSAAFETALEHLDSFRGESSLYTWLHAIAVNDARSRARKRAAITESIDTLDPRKLLTSDIQTETLERSECCEKIRCALRRVPSLYRRTLVDHFVRGYSVRRVARVHRVPVGTVLSRIFAGKRMLREAWEA